MLDSEIVNGNLLQYNEVLFKNMSHYVDAVWVVDEEDDSVEFLKDKIHSEKHKILFSFAETYDFIKAICHPDYAENTMCLCNKDFLFSLKESFSSQSVVLVCNQYHRISFTITPSFNGDGKVKKVYVSLVDLENKLNDNN